MQVICIEDIPNQCRNSSRIVPVPIFGEIYTVQKTEKSFCGDYYVYILNEFPHDVGYETISFIPLSEIDEMELVNNKQETINEFIL